MYQTNHQREILSLFKNHPEQGYTGVEIVHLFKETINKATIYRKLKNIDEIVQDDLEKGTKQSYFTVDTIKSFIGNMVKIIENKIIRKNYNPIKKCFEYQFSSDCENHLHLICKQCGKITHLVCEETNGFIAHISLQHAFEVDKLSTTIFGLCQECKTYA